MADEKADERESNAYEFAVIRSAFLCDPHYVSDFGFLGSPNAHHPPRQPLRPSRQPGDVAILEPWGDCS